MPSPKSCYPWLLYSIGLAQLEYYVYQVHWGLEFAHHQQVLLCWINIFAESYIEHSLACPYCSNNSVIHQTLKTASASLAKINAHTNWSYLQQLATTHSPTKTNGVLCNSTFHLPTRHEMSLMSSVWNYEYEFENGQVNYSSTYQHRAHHKFLR